MLMTINGIQVDQQQLQDLAQRFSKYNLLQQQNRISTGSTAAGAILAHYGGGAGSAAASELVSEVDLVAAWAERSAAKGLFSRRSVWPKRRVWSEPRTTWGTKLHRNSKA